MRYPNCLTSRRAKLAMSSAFFLLVFALVALVYAWKASSPATSADAMSSQPSNAPGTSNAVAASSWPEAGTDPSSPSNANQERDQSSPSAVEAYGKLPLAFEANQGQTDPRVRFLARGEGYGLFLTSSSAVLRLARPDATNCVKDSQLAEEKCEAVASGNEKLTMQFEGGSSSSPPVGLEKLPGQSNYFIGSNRTRWLTNVASYQKVLYRNVYPGIDVVYYGNQRELEYDLILAPGVSPNKIQMTFAGANDVTVESAGHLLLSTSSGDIRQQKPFAYQEINGARREVAAAYRVEDGRVGFEVGDYDSTRPLVIDPVLIYSSFVGGSNLEQGTGIAVDSQGSAYITGVTASTDFPLAAPLQNAKDSFNDAFVVKLNPAGNAMIYATYLGGNGDDGASGIAVDSAGNAYVTGFTGSGGFPTTPGAFQNTKDGSIDAFLTKLSPSGSTLVYSTFLGGDNSDNALGIAVDGGNRAYIVGRTESTRFRTFPFPTPRKGNPIYKSTDSAASWSPSSTGLTASFVSCFAQDPVTATTIYAGTSSGVFKSIDAGTSWSLTGFSPPVNASFSTNAVVIDPTNSSTIYAATLSGIYKSTDGGGSYAQKNSGLATLPVLALAVDPNAPAILYAGTQLGVYKSTDGGESWTEINNGTNFARVSEIVVDPSQSPATTVYLGTANRGMLKTTNGGAQWTQINNGISNTPVTALVIDPANPATLYAGISSFPGVLVKTTNGGGNWTSSANGITGFSGINTLAINPINSSIIYASSNVGGIFKSSDGGANWSQSNSGFLNLGATAIATDRSNPANLFAGTTIGADAFAARFNAAGNPEYILNFGGDENDEARAVAFDSQGNAYIAGSTNSSNLPTVSAFQSATGGGGDGFLASVNSSGSAFNYLTYFGGSGADQPRGIAVAPNGSVYVVGSTSSPNFPLINPIKGAPENFDTDAFITKLSPTGALDFSTCLGGQSVDQAFAIAVDQNGSAYITGQTQSSDFPVQSAPQSTISGASDAFVTKLSAANTISYSTFLGGSFTDQGNGIAVDTTGNAYIVGTTSSSNFPTLNPLQSYRGSTDAFVAKLGSAPDVVVTMTGSPNSVAYGSNLTYTIVVSNAGEVAAENVTLNNTLLSGTGVISINSTRGTCSGNRFITCAFSTLEPGAGATVTIVVRPPAIATMINTATAATTTPEATTANNTAVLNTPVLFTDLMLKNTSALLLSDIGGVNKYIITVTNKGPAAASAIVVTNNLPSETTFENCTSTNAGVCGGSGNNRTVTVPSLAVGASFTAIIAARINNSVTAGTVITDTASVTSAVPDINPNNDAQTTTTTARAASGQIQNGLIAFISRDGSFTTGDDIWIANPDGTGHKNLAHGVNPAWSPDGTRIAYVTWPDGIHVMNSDGSNDIQLTSSAYDGSPTWSPDGTRIAFSGNSPGSFGIHIMNSDGTYVKTIISNGGSPSWSPDGTRIAFFGGLGFSVMFADGAGVTKVQLPHTPTGHSWSPDSSQLVISLLDNSAFGSSIYIVNPDGTGLTKIENTSGGAAPSWSPDGTKIAFSLPPSAGAPLEVHTINLDGTGLLRINGPLKGGYDPDWQRRPANFPPLPPSFTISGKLTSASNGNPIGGSVNVTGSVTRTVSADSTNGDYVIKGLPLGGNYTLTPSIFGGTPTTPPNRQYNNLSANQTGADFAFNFPAQEPITGFVKDPTGAPLASVRLGLGNSFGGTAFTDGTGFYTFGSAFPGAQAYVIPFAENSYANYQFDPQILFIQSRSGNNFVGRPKTASISGTVTVGGVGKAGVLVSTSNPPATSTTTDTNGNYTFNGIGEGLTVTVTVDTRVYPFAPSKQTLTVNGQKTGVNFDAPLNQFVIYGQVDILGASSDEGVTITLSGAANATTQTDAQGNYSLGPVPANANYTVTASRPGHSFVPASATAQNLSSNVQLGFTGYTNTVQFYFDTVQADVGETDGKATLTVVRSGLISEVLKVDYRTNDVTAGHRTDYTATLGTLTFAPQEQAKTLVIPINDDSYVEGDESFTVTLINPVGALVGPLNSAVVNILDDDTAAPTVNPLDAGAFFVRQHYHDFLNRIPDSSGLTFWSEQITDCGLDAGCTDARRTNVSAAFYLSIEFQQTGYLVERIYKSAYGDASGTSNFGPTHQLPVPIVRFDEFLPDTQEIGRGVVVGVGNWEAQLEANKVAFAQTFVARSRFATAYPTSLTPAQFVDALYFKAGVTPSASELSSVVSEFGGAGNTVDNAARARALRRVAENATLIQQESNKAFVLMQYFGYLRRNPNDLPDSDYTGYDFWLTKLNQFNGNYIQAEMVRAFISSTEYRQRFGP